MSIPSCSICFDEIDIKLTGLVTLPCGHHNHMNCITRWFSNHDSCPICRKEMDGLSEAWKETPEVNTPEVNTAGVNSPYIYISRFESVQADNWIDATSLNSFFRQDTDEEYTPIVDPMDRRISLNLTQFLNLYYDHMYETRIHPSTITMWKYLSESNICERAPPEYAGELRLYFTYNHLRNIVMGDAWADLSENDWKNILYYIDNPQSRAFYSAGKDYDDPIQLPVTSV